MAQPGRSFAADMRAKKGTGPPKPRPRNPNVQYDAAGNALNPIVPPSSPFATMQKGRPVEAAYSGTPNDQLAQGARDVGQTLADTYHLGQTPLPWQTAAASPPPVVPAPPPVKPNLPPSLKKGKKNGR